MSRSKKQLDDIAELNRIIKDKDSTIKSLERQLRKLNDELSPPPKKEKKKVEEVQIDNSHKCPTCSKKLAVTHLGIKVLWTCICGFRLLKKSDGP